MNLLAIGLAQLFPLLSTLVGASALDHGNNTTAQAATELLLTYAYPLLAFKSQYLALSQLLEVNHVGHSRQLSTPASRYVVKPNVDTLYSTITFDISTDDLSIVVPNIPEQQYALVSFHDLYGNNFALLEKHDLNRNGTYRLSHGQHTYASENASHNASSTIPAEDIVRSPTTFGIILIRWLLTGSNLNAVHSLQNMTQVNPVPKHVAEGNQTTSSPIGIKNIAWNSSGLAPAEDTLRIICQLSPENTPGTVAGNLTIQKALEASGACTNGSNSSIVDLDAANKTALHAADSAGQDASYNMNNGWSVVQSNLTGDFGTDYPLRVEIASTGYLMLKAPNAVYPTWSNGSKTRPMEGQTLQLGSNESYIYKFSSKPLLHKLGFWSLTAYNSDGFLIENLRNVSSLGDRSNITYPSGSAIYGSGSRAEDNGPFEILIQPADIAPPSNWTANWLPGPPGGGNLTVLLRWYEAMDGLLNGTYQYPKVTKQAAVTLES